MRGPRLLAGTFGSVVAGMALLALYLDRRFGLCCLHWGRFITGLLVGLALCTWSAWREAHEPPGER